MTPELQPELFCRATVYSRSKDGEDRPCSNIATKEDFCYAHDPDNTARREKRWEEKAKDRIRKKELARRKLLLIPVLEEAQKRYKKIQNEQGRLGATLMLNVIRNAIREEK